MTDEQDERVERVAERVWTYARDRLRTAADHLGPTAGRKLAEAAKATVFPAPAQHPNLEAAADNLRRGVTDAAKAPIERFYKVSDPVRDLLKFAAHPTEPGRAAKAARAADRLHKLPGEDAMDALKGTWHSLVKATTGGAVVRSYASKDAQRYLQSLQEIGDFARHPNRPGAREKFEKARNFLAQNPVERFVKDKDAPKVISGGIDAGVEGVKLGLQARGLAGALGGGARTFRAPSPTGRSGHTGPKARVGDKRVRPGSARPIPKVEDSGGPKTVAPKESPAPPGAGPPTLRSPEWKGSTKPRGAGSPPPGNVDGPKSRRGTGPGGEGPQSQKSIDPQSDIPKTQRSPEARNHPDPGRTATKRGRGPGPGSTPPGSTPPGSGPPPGGGQGPKPAKPKPGTSAEPGARNQVDPTAPTERAPAPPGPENRVSRLATTQSPHAATKPPGGTRDPVRPLTEPSGDSRLMNDHQVWSVHSELSQMEAKGIHKGPDGRSTPRYRELWNKLDKHLEAKEEAFLREHGEPPPRKDGAPKPGGSTELGTARTHADPSRTQRLESQPRRRHSPIPARDPRVLPSKEHDALIAKMDALEGAGRHRTPDGKMTPEYQQLRARMSEHLEGRAADVKAWNERQYADQAKAPPEKSPEAKSVPPPGETPRPGGTPRVDQPRPKPGGSSELGTAKTQADARHTQRLRPESTGTKPDLKSAAEAAYRRPEGRSTTGSPRDSKPGKVEKPRDPGTPRPEQHTPRTHRPKG